MNSRPHPYQGCALPLSYRGAVKRRAPIVPRAQKVKPSLQGWRCIGNAFRMSEETDKNMSRAMTKEERLAAKLRENLRRRKAQAREITESNSESLPKGEQES